MRLSIPLVGLLAVLEGRGSVNDVRLLPALNVTAHFFNYLLCLLLKFMEADLSARNKGGLVQGSESCFVANVSPGASNCRGMAMPS
mmetsp:Transcript_26251/g.32841  ORF Transcript_26251/g.32841 Transcript_26251/m.32841 type:complete len:86 (-) Transcript_26251:1132-1389(-)